MTQMSWTGVLPAITTPFDQDLDVDHEFLAQHATRMIDAGCTGIVACGSLGEGATLSFEEKCEILETCVMAVGERVPVIPGVAALSTREAVRLAQRAAELGCRGLMVLPPYVHRGPWPEIEGHFQAVLEATPLSCMLYNNPAAYGVDVTPDQIATLARRHDNLHAVKESSGDVRRVTAVKSLVGDRLQICAGLDDMILEAIDCGAVGWVAGLVNAMPEHSVKLVELALTGKRDEAFALYSWFLPLLRLDTVPEFVQLIKLVQSQVGMGTERVRRPRRPAEGQLREEALAVILSAISRDPLSPRSREA